MKAWLLTWEGTSGPALVPEKKIIAILSSRRSSSAIEELVDVLYCRGLYCAYDMAALANKRKVRERQFRQIGSNFHRFFYGSNPCIFARVVSDLKVERDEEQKMETICWTELPIFKNAPYGSIPVQVEPARECQLVRSLVPLEHDN
jgi:hypothetical protein